MKVLMFGWEFPPHISGGLGTACYGLTKGLAKNDVEVLFVMPKLQMMKIKLTPELLTPVLLQWILPNPISHHFIKMSPLLK